MVVKRVVMLLYIYIIISRVGKGELGVVFLFVLVFFLVFLFLKMVLIEMFYYSEEEEEWMV